MRGPRAFTQEVGQDRAEAAVVGVAVLAVLQHLHRVGGITAGLDPGHTHMGATDVGGQERGRDSGQDMGRGGVAGGHAGSCCRWGRTRERGRRLGGVCNPADNDVNEFVTLSLLRRNERGMQ
jgi:hypothetical protein